MQRELETDPETDPDTETETEEFVFLLRRAGFHSFKAFTA